MFNEDSSSTCQSFANGQSKRNEELSTTNGIGPDEEVLAECIFACNLGFFSSTIAAELNDNELELIYAVE